MATFRVNLKEQNPNKCHDPYKEFNGCLNEIIGQIDSLHLKQSQTNSIYSLLLKIVEVSSKLLQNICDQENWDKTILFIKKAEDYTRKEISKFSTSYKRNTFCENSPRYVRPVERAIGFQWKSRFDLSSNSPRHTFKQNTFQYIPILETLESLCANKDFLNACKNNGHKS